MLRLGLPLGGLFAWLLSFPMYGPLLFYTAGDTAPRLGLVFTLAHGAGLVLWSVLWPGAAAQKSLQAGAGGLIAVLTLAYLPLAPAAIPATTVVAVLGLLAALPVLTWCRSFVAAGAPFGALAIAMAGANVVLAMCSFPAAIPPAAGLSVLAVLAAGSILFMGAGEPLPAEQTGAPAHVPVPLGALATFAVANFFVGGIWYQIVAASWSPAWAWRPLLEPLVYAAGIALLAVRLRRDPPAMLALYGLSCLGLGLLAGLSGLGGDAAMAVHRALVLVGLAAADLFYWHQLGLRGQRAMGLGLGLSVLLIGSATMTASAFPPDGGRPHPLFLLSGAALLFLMIPLVFRPQGRAPSDAAPAPLSILAAPMPENLTPAERQVYAMLLRGASDAEIAAELVVTKHTVKFHVRNVLRKLGVANRKELLSRIVAGSGHEA